MFAITAITALASALVLFANGVSAAPTGDSQLAARQGYASDCVTTYSVQGGDTCLAIIHKFNDTFTLDDFYDWNPQVAQDCSNLYPSEVVCVGVEGTGTAPPPACPFPTAPGLVADCADCYEVVEGDNCYVVTQAHGISLDDFRLWNPSLTADCNNLMLGYNYCVGV
ncbi:carbohydrate-binding module family 50 protein [Hypoxylon sp. FL1284]|nr:carbohydrate-binding module family 50 protein [Hypoxylon sp. FL1284]